MADISPREMTRSYALMFEGIEDAQTIRLIEKICETSNQSHIERKKFTAIMNVINKNAYYTAKDLVESANAYPWLKHANEEILNDNFDIEEHSKKDKLIMLLSRIEGLSIAEILLIKKYVFQYLEDAVKTSSPIIIENQKSGDKTIISGQIFDSKNMDVTETRRRAYHKQQA